MAAAFSLFKYMTFHSCTQYFAMNSLYRVSLASLLLNLCSLIWLKVSLEISPIRIYTQSFQFEYRMYEYRLYHISILVQYYYTLGTY